MTRPEMLAEARRLQAVGISNRQIALRFGVSNSTVGRWLNPGVADRSRERSLEAKRRRTGICADCGGLTRYVGKATLPERCLACSVAKQKAERRWTQGTVIDAIQRFAAKHGRPPFAREWIRADPTNGYPACSTVHSTHGRYTPPFNSWADAIEAAGFPRPRVGGYRRTLETRARMSEAQRRRYARDRAAA